MIIHFALVSFICIYGAIIYLDKSFVHRKRNRSFVIATFFLIFLIQALRSKNVGWDTINYYNLAQYIPRLHVINSRWEPMFVILYKFSNMLTPDPQMLFVLSAAIINCLIGKFILDNSEETESAFWMTFLHVTLLPYFNSMNQLREYLAIAIGVQSYTNLKHEYSKLAFIKSVLLIFVAFLFHRVALVMLLIPMVMYLRKIGVKEIFLIIIASAAFVIGFDYVIQLVIRVFPIYARYMETDYAEGLSGSGFHFFIAAIKILFLVFYYINTNKKALKAQMLNKESVFCMVSIVLTFLRLRISFAVRVGYYFDLMAFLFMTKTAFYTTKNNRFVIYPLLLTAGIISFTYLLMSPFGSRGTSVYTFFWQC